MKSKKLLIVLSLILSLTFPLFANEEKEPVVAVVLAGGGALGFAHVGALQVLEEEGIRPDYIIGTSMGSIIGGLYSVGYSGNELEQIVRETSWKEILLDSFDRREISFNRKKHESNYRLSVDLDKNESIDEAGLSQGQHVVELLDELLSPYNTETDFDSLPIPFRAVAADLMTGEKVVFEEGDLKTAIRASMAVPGLFTPVRYRDRYLIDGGWVENLPTTVARELGADIVIAVSLFSMTDDIEKLSTLIGLSSQADQIRTMDRNRMSAEAADFIISPDLTGYGMADYEQGEALMARGYAAADSRRDEIRSMAENINSSETLLRKDDSDPVINIRRIKIEEADSEMADKIKIYLKEKMGLSPRSSKLREQIYNLYDSGEYGHVWYRLLPATDGQYDLVIDAPVLKRPKDSLSFSLNFGSYLAESRTGDINLKIAYQGQFDKAPDNGFFAEVWGSEYPSMMAGLVHEPGWGEGILALRGGVLQSKQYFYEDDTLDSQYILGKLGGSLFYDQPLFRRFELSLGAYGRHNWTDRKMGSQLFAEKDWLRYGVKAMISMDTLNKTLLPDKGIRFLMISDTSLDNSGEFSNVFRNAGEAYIPLIPSLSGGLFLKAEYQSVAFGDIETMELPSLGSAFPVYGYFPQELKGENSALGGLGFKIRVASLPYSMGDGIYLQLAGNSAALWRGRDTDQIREYDFYHGAAASILLNTHLGILEAGLNLNKDLRWSLFVGLASSTVFYEDRYY